MIGSHDSLPFFFLSSSSFVKLTLSQAAFKSIVDKFTPKDWKQECTQNMDAPAIPATPQPAGY